MSTQYRVEAVSRTFDGDVRALDGVDLTVAAGEFVVLLGRSGCGKSTLLEIMAGLQLPDSGRVLLGDREVTGPDPRIGLVFQDPSLYPWRTVARNVELGLEIAGVSREQRRATARAYLEQVGLAGTGDRWPHQLSGGMRQRVGIARALATRPEVLLMDEPFGAVDHLTRLTLQADLLTLWSADRRTVVFVTHDVNEAVLLADRIVLMAPGPGRIARQWTLDARRPRSLDDPATAALRTAIHTELEAVPDREEPAGHV